MLSNEYKENESDKSYLTYHYEDDLLIFDLTIHVMNYVKSLFINQQ